MILVIQIVILLIVGVFIYIKFITWKDNKDYFKEHKGIFDAHKSIGYPELTKEDQFKILDHGDLTSVKKLTEFDFVPTGLLNHYITIEPDDYFKHLKKSSLLEKMNIDNLKEKLTDGFYIEKKGNSVIYIFNDRYSRVFEKEFESEDKFLKYLVKERLAPYT
jgi:hypothetical protein